MPARIHRHHVGLALAQGAGGAGPAAQFDIAGVVELGFVIADQGFQISRREFFQNAPVPGEFGIRVAVGAGKMRHAAARQDHGFQAKRGDGAGDRLAELVAALHGRLRRQIGVDVNRQHRAGVPKMGERNADGVVDLRRRTKGRIEILPVQLAHQFEADFARNLPMEFAAGEFARRLAADMDCERRRGGVEELLGVVVGEDDPKVGLECAQPLADVGCDLAHMGDQRLVLGVGHSEELRRMGQHGAADHGRHHGGSPWPQGYRAGGGTTSAGAARGSHACARFTGSQEADSFAPARRNACEGT